MAVMGTERHVGDQNEFGLLTFDSGVLPEEMTRSSDLDQLAGMEAVQFARSLRGVLDEVGFDQLNRDIRADYASSPLPLLSYAQIDEDIAALHPRHLKDTEVTLINVFLLGRETGREKLQAALGPEGASIVSRGLDLGIFREGEDHSIALDNLILSSRKLSDGQMTYVFGDPPPYMKSAGLKRQRVYLGTDSYLLNAKLQGLSKVAGTVVEFGSGSGIQLITLLMMNPAIEHGLGIEIDARARNVSRFNAALNGVEGRLELIESTNGTGDALAGRPVALAFSNPPFIAAPYEVHVPSLRDTVNISEALCRAGWGGEDGLYHTRSFLREMKPWMDHSGQIIIFSQFAGNDEGPTAILECAGSLDFPAIVFEKFPGDNYGMNLTASEWATHTARQFKIENAFASVAVSEALEKESQAMFARNGITRFHSGFVTLSCGEPRIEHDELRKQEESLQLWSGTTRRPSLLLQLSHYIQPGDLLQARGLGTRTYSPPEMSAEAAKLTTVLCRRCIRGGYGLEVGISESNDFQYSVCDGQGKCVESGDVYETEKAAFTAAYQNVLSAVEPVDPQKLLRSWKISYCRSIGEPGLINEALGTHFTDLHLLVELIPAVNMFRVSRCETKGAFDADRIELFRGTIMDPACLRFLLALKKTDPNFPGF